jgi:hypothetical protein
MSQISTLRDYFKTEKGASYSSYNIDNNLFGGYCLSLFSSVNQFSVVNILGEYRHPTERRVNKVVAGHAADLLVASHPSGRLPDRRDRGVPHLR